MLENIEKQNWTLLKLNKDLKEFGLNPSEWSLVPQNECKYQVISNSDFNFRFVGEATSAENGLAKWKMLSIESI